MSVVAGCAQLADKEDGGGEAAARKEALVSLPDFPRDTDLVPIDVDAHDSSHAYLVDIRSISRGADGTIRYTVVIQSPAGTRNVLHQGLRCGPREFTTYAYGTRRGRFRKFPDRPWRRVFRHGAMAHTGALADTYLCDAKGWPLNLKRIVMRLREGGWDGGYTIHEPEH